MNSNDYRAHMVANAKRRANASYTGAMRSTPSDIKHWKYIKRERGKNGKWRYYYDTEALKGDIKDKLGYDEKERMQDAERNMSRNIEARDQAMKDYHTNREATNTTIEEYKKKSEEAGSPKKVIEYAKAATAEATVTKNKATASVAYYHQMSEAAKSAGQKYVNAKTAYNNTPLGQVDQAKASVRKGMRAVSNYLKNLFKKKDK